MPRLSDAILLAVPVMTSLMTRMEIEAELEEGNGQHFGIVQKADGFFLSHNPGSPELVPDQMIFAQDVLRLLNRELHHDGAWCIVFTHPKPPAVAGSMMAEYSRFVFLWLDRDGDVQIPHEWREGEAEDLFDWTDVLLAGPVLWGDHLENSWQQWNWLMCQVLAPSEDQLFKKAQGQVPSSAH